MSFRGMGVGENMFKTSAYDAIKVKGYDGNYYTINISKRTRSRDCRDDLIHMENEVFDTI